MKPSKAVELRKKHTAKDVRDTPRFINHKI